MRLESILGGLSKSGEPTTVAGIFAGESRCMGVNLSPPDSDSELAVYFSAENRASLVERAFREALGGFDSSPNEQS